MRQTALAGGWVTSGFRSIPLAVVVCVLSSVHSRAQETQSSATRCPAPATPGTGAVTGWVQDAATGVRLGLSTVRLLNVETGETRRTRANRDGTFAFCSTSEGLWRVDATLEDYQGSASVEVLPRQGSVVVLDLSIPGVAGRSGRLAGRVVDAASEAPVAHATVELSEGRRRTVTGSDGGFSFPFLEPGILRFRVTMLGYADAEGEVRVSGGQVLEVEVRLDVRAIAIEPIIVTAVRREHLLTGIAELEWRIASGWGQFILEDQIRMRSPTRVTDLLYETGVHVTNNGRSIVMRRTLCAPTVYIDDVKVTGRCPRGGSLIEGRRRGDSPRHSPACDASEEAAEAVNLLDPSSIYAIEVYRGPAETPGQYLDSDAKCGVILLWTRRGGEVGRRERRPRRRPDRVRR